MNLLLMANNRKTPTFPCQEEQKAVSCFNGHSLYSAAKHWSYTQAEEWSLIASLIDQARK